MAGSRTAPALRSLLSRATLCVAASFALAAHVASQSPGNQLSARLHALHTLGYSGGASTLSYGSRLGDFDGDGLVDIVSAATDGEDPFTNQRLSLVRGLPGGSFTEPVDSGAQTFQFHGGFLAGDVTGDGLDDLLHYEAASPSAPKFVRVFEGLAAGGFLPRDPGPPVAVGAAPSLFYDAHELADLDADGDLDLIVAGRLLPSTPPVFVMGFYENLGGGELRAFASLGTVGEVVGLERGDLDGDGVVDLLTYAPATGELYALFGAAGPTFPDAQLLPDAAPTNAGNYRLTDVDGDGALDLLWSYFVEADAPALRVSYGDGAGGFAAAVGLPVASQVLSAECADLDADGLRDLVVLRFTFGVDLSPESAGETAQFFPSLFRVEFARGLGGGAFAAPESLASPAPFVRLAIADIEGDGDLDLLGLGAEFLTLLRAAPAGDLRHDDTFGADATPRSIQSQQLADLTGDGLADLLQVLDDATLRVQHVLPGGALDAPVDVDMGLDTAGGAHVRDLDGDGLADLALEGTLGGVNLIAMRLALAGGGYAPVTQVDLGPRDVVTFGDLDGTHGLDFVAGDGSGSSSQFQIFRAQAGGGFLAGLTLGAGSNYSELVLADTSGDGVDDLLIAGNPLRYREADGLGGFLPQVTVQTGHHATVLSADFDGDGRLDIAFPGATFAGSSGSSFVYVFRSVDPGPFEITSRHLVQGVAHTERMQALDVDGDGRPDIVLNGGERALIVDASLGFSEQRRYVTDTASFFGDANGDGAFDRVALTDDGRHARLVRGFASSPWTGLGEGLAGTAGQPLLQGLGSLEAGSTATLALNNARPFAPATLVVGLTRIDAPFKAGVLVPAPDKLLPPQITSALGLAARNLPVPPGFAGIELFWQSWVVDPAAPSGLAASNALSGVLP